MKLYLAKKKKLTMYSNCPAQTYESYFVRWVLNRQAPVK